MPAPRHTRAAAVAAALSAALVVAMATTAAANVDQDCQDFPSQVQAQAALDAATGDPDLLDADHDQVACDSFDFAAAAAARAAAASSTATTTPTAAPSTSATTTTTEPVTPDRNCDDFTTQAEAQAALTADPADPDGLDADKDGVACEERFGTQNQQVAVIPNGAVNTGGTFRR